MSVHDFYEDYDIPKSEVDELVDEATDKVVELILDRAKEQVDAVMSKADKEAKNKQYWQDLYNAQKKTTDELLSKNRQLQSELEKKRTDVGLLQYSVGQAVYRVSKPCSGERKVTCVTCNGKGRVRGLLGSRPVDATCPDCLNCSSKFDSNKYVREHKYYQARPVASTIEKINITFYKKSTLEDEVFGEDPEDVREVTYLIDGTWFKESDISEDITLVRTICDEFNNAEEEKALKLVGRWEEASNG